MTLHHYLESDDYMPRLLKNFSPSRLRTLAGGLLVSVMPFLAGWLVWFPAPGSRHYLTVDFVENFGPRSYLYRAIAQGHLPLWDPFKETGVPFLSYLFDIFNPVFLLYPFLLENGYLRNDVAQLMLVIHLAIGALGAYLWGLDSGKGRTASTVMGLIWGLNGFLMGNFFDGHDMVIHTMAWAPYLFLFLDRARRRGSALASAWGGFFLALVFNGGHPQFFYYVAIALGIHALYWGVLLWQDRGPAEGWRLWWRMYLPLGITAALLSAPQLLHFATTMLGGLKSVHPYGNKIDLTFSMGGSAQPSFLLNYLFPTIRWGGTEGRAYLGIFPLACGFMAIYYLRRREEGYWKLLAAVTVVLMMGGSMGLHKVLISLLPAYRNFREPERWGILIHLAFTFLAGSGVVWLLKREPGKVPAALLRALAVAMLMVGGMLLWCASAQKLGLHGRHSSPQFVVNAVLGTFVLLALTWFILKRVNAGRRGTGLRLFLIAVVAVDLGFYYMPNTLYNLRDYPADPSHVTPHMEQKARQMLALTQGRPQRFRFPLFYLHLSAAYRAGIMHSTRIPPHVARLMPRGYWEIMWRKTENPRFLDLMSISFIEKKMEMVKARRSSWKLVGFSQAACRLEQGQEVKSLALTARAIFTEGLKPGQTIARLGLRRGGRLVASWPLRWGKEVCGRRVALPLDHAVAADELLMASTHPRVEVLLDQVLVNGRPAQDHPQLVPAELNLLRNPNALPLVYFVSRAAVIPADSEFRDALLSVDPSRCVLLRKAPPGFQPPRGLDVSPGGRAEIVSWAPERVEVKLRCRRRGFVVMTQDAYPGWRAELDGRPVPILHGFDFLITVPVPAGEHRLVFTYAEPWTLAGIPLALAALALLLGWSLWWRRRRFPSPVEGME